MFLHADSEDSDQIRRMPKLIGVFAGRTGRFVGFVMQLLNANIPSGFFHPYYLDESISYFRGV